MPDSGKPRVLVVDDESDLRELLVDALSDSQVEIHCAASGKEAIRLAMASRPDLIVTDLCLGDCTGLDVIDRLRALTPDIPAIVITGQADAAAFSEASRRRPLEMLNKPLDLDRLRRAVRTELSRQSDAGQLHRRVRKLRTLARHINRERKTAQQQLDTTCQQLTGAYRSLANQLNLQKSVMAFQQELLTARSDDEIFKALFGVFVRHSGPVYGVAMVCDSEAQLQLAGRFGVPVPDGQPFANALAKPVIDMALANPKCFLMDAGEQADQFDPAVRKYLCGLSILAVPLLPDEGQMIGLIVLYRKGEQPFHDSDLALAEMISRATATAIQRNE